MFGRRNDRSILSIVIGGVVCVAIVTAIMTATGGWEGMKSWFSSTKESLTGVSFKIMTYDSYGNNNMTVYGSKIKLGLLENNANFNSEDTGFKSEVLDITIDGSQLIHVGSTMVMAEQGIDAIEDFDMDYFELHSTEGSSGFIPWDRTVNRFTNNVGKSKIIIIKSQMGVIVGAYQGDSVYVTIPANLPKTTKLSIDGKIMYIYRADYDIMDMKLFNKGQ